MVESNKNPEGIEVAREILTNAPNEILENFLSLSSMVREMSPSDIWNEVVNKFYDKQIG